MQLDYYKGTKGILSSSNAEFMFIKSWYCTLRNQVEQSVLYGMKCNIGFGWRSTIKYNFIGIDSFYKLITFLIPKNLVNLFAKEITKINNICLRYLCFINCKGQCFPRKGKLALIDCVNQLNLFPFNFKLISRNSHKKRIVVFVV